MLAHDPRLPLDKLTHGVLRENAAFLVDTTVGHRALDDFKRMVPARWFRDSVDHNTHLLVVVKK